MYSASGLSHRILATLLVGIINLGCIPVFAAQNSTVVGYIGDYRSVDASLPTASNQKGKLGSILAEIFGTGSINGKIKQDYLDTTGLSPWTYSGSSIAYVGGNVGIGTTTPAEALSFGPDNSVVIHNGGEKAIGFDTFYTAVIGWQKTNAANYQ